MRGRVEWSNLPNELWLRIGKRLDTRVDVVRFRSVCRSWRSSIPPFCVPTPRFPLKFPSPHRESGEPPSPAPELLPLQQFVFPKRSYEAAYLRQRTFYELKLLNPTSTSSTPAAAVYKGWLIEVEEESNSGQLRLLNPANICLSECRHRGHSKSNRGISYPVNLLYYQIVELTRAYTLGSRSATTSSENERIYVDSCRSIPGVHKAVMVPKSAKTEAEVCSIFVIFGEAKLGFANCGDGELTQLVVDLNVDCDDIILFKDQLYVADKLGIIWRIEWSSLKLVQLSPPFSGLGNPTQKKRLVESCGALYVVDRYFNKKPRSMKELMDYFGNIVQDDAMTIRFRVYKLDEELGHLVSEESLGDRVFILGPDFSLSFSALEISGYRSNCIYFTEQNEQNCALVFNLEDRSIKPVMIDNLLINSG